MMLPLRCGSLYHETVGDGYPLLAMHGGLGLDHTTLRPWLDPLGDLFEMVYYDHLANGRSQFEGDPDDLTHDLWVETADALRAHLGHERITVLGHSYGAVLALEYALRHPDRVRALILSNVAPALDYPEVVMGNARRKAPDDATYEATVELLSAPAPSDEALARGFRAIAPLYFHRSGPDTGQDVLSDVRFRALPMNRGTFACMPTFDVEDRLSEIRAPALVLSGADDWIMPPAQAGARVAAGIPSAEHVVFECSGHWPFVEENQRFLEVVREWWAGVA